MGVLWMQLKIKKILVFFLAFCRIYIEFCERKKMKCREKKKKKEKGQ